MTQRDNKGRFTPGNKAATGNPMAKKVQQLRSALIRCVKVQDVQDIAKALIEEAKHGDTGAAKLLLERTLGPPVAVDIEARIEELEALFEKDNGNAE